MKQKLFLWIIDKLLPHISDMRYTRYVDYLIARRDNRHEAIPLNVWKLVTKRLRTELNVGYQAAQDGQDVKAARALLVIFNDFKILEDLIVEYEQRTKRNRDKGTKE